MLGGLRKIQFLLSCDTRGSLLVIIGLKQRKQAAQGPQSWKEMSDFRLRGCNLKYHFPTSPSDSVPLWFHELTG